MGADRARSVRNFPVLRVCSSTLDGLSSAGAHPSLTLVTEVRDSESHTFRSIAPAGNGQAAGTHLDPDGRRS